MTSIERIAQCITDHCLACSLKRIKHSRAYLNFLEASEVLKFRSQFAGHAFVNKKGAQYRCVVEYAPYQRIPREKAKQDPREGTYENGKCTCCILQAYPCLTEASASFSTLAHLNNLLCATDVDFIAFKQQMEGDPEFLPSAEMQMDLKQQAKKALAGGLPALHICQHQQDHHVMPSRLGLALLSRASQSRSCNVLSVTGLHAMQKQLQSPRSRR